MTKLAPFGKHLSQLDIPPTNDVYIFVGPQSWDKAKKSIVMRPSRTLCLPPNESPFNFIWPVTNCDILIFDTGKTDELLIQNLVLTLFNHDANIIRYISQYGSLTLFKRI